MMLVLSWSAGKTYTYATKTEGEKGSFVSGTLCCTVQVAVRGGGGGDLVGFPCLRVRV
jgi:hypothetical protein